MRKISLYTQNIVLVIVVCLLCLNCSKPATTDSNPTSTTQTLVTATPLLPMAISKTLIISPDFSSYPNYQKYDVTLYQLTYKTTYQGATIEASSLLAVPQSNTALFPILSYQHGTNICDATGPSDIGIYPNITLSNEQMVLILLASMGYVVSAPDYIGYLRSASVIHPYHIAAPTVAACMDALMAAKEYCDGNNILLSNKLFLAGYSEGGYATVALHKYLESHTTPFDLVAASAGGGAYDLNGSAQSVLTVPYSEGVYYYGFLVYAYNHFYGLNRAINDIFLAPYNQYVNEGYFDGDYPDSLVVAKFNIYNASQLFNATVISQYLSGQDQTLSAKLSENSLLNWCPTKPLFLYQGTDDTVVASVNMTNAYAAFTTLGSTSVQMISVPGGTHISAANTWMAGTLSTFLTTYQAYLP